MPTVIDTLIIQGNGGNASARIRLPVLRDHQDDPGAHPVRREDSISDLHGEMSTYGSYTPVVRRLEHMARTRAAREGMSTMDADDLPVTNPATSRTIFLVQGQKVTRGPVRPLTEPGMYRKRPQAMRLPLGWDGLDSSRSYSEPARAVTFRDARSSRSLKSGRSGMSSISLQLPALAIGEQTEFLTERTFPTHGMGSIEAYLSDPATDDLDIIKVRLKRKKMMARGRNRDPPRMSQQEELRSCLQVRPSNKCIPENIKNELKLRHQTQFMQSQAVTGSTENLHMPDPRGPHKQIAAQRKPRYKFGTLDSYLNFNHKQVARVGGELVFLNSTQVQTPAPSSGHSDARLLRLMLEMNRPQSRLSSALYSDIAVHRDLDDFFQVRPPRLDARSRKSWRSEKSHAHETLSEGQEEWGTRET